MGADDRDRQGEFQVSRGSALRRRSATRAIPGRARTSGATQGRRSRVQSQGKDTGRRSARGKGPRGRGAAGKPTRSGSESNQS